MHGPRLEPAWRYGLLALALAIGALYLWIGAHAVGNQRPDAAYYLGVARHIAESGRLEEPLVWHFLNLPPRVVHPPFDYWAPLTSLVLVPLLRWFGTGDAVAFTTMAAISALGVVAFALLLLRAPATRWAPLQLVALLLFAFSPAAWTYRFDSESLPLFHLILVAVLLAFQARHYAAAIAVASLLVWCRSGDGAVLCALVWLACFVVIFQLEPAARRVALRWGVLAAVTAALGYAAFNVALHGSPVPPAARLGPLLRDPLDLLRAGTEYDASPASVLSLLRPGRLGSSVREAAETLLAVEFVPFHLMWLVLAALSGLSLLRGRIDTAGLATVLAFGGAVLTRVAANAVHSERAALALLPVVVFAGTCGAERALRWAGGELQSRLGRRTAVVAAALLLVGCGYAYARRIEIPAERGPAWLGTPSLARLRGTLDDRAVASELPYFVLAETGQPAVTLPLDGEAAIDAILERYEVGWLVLFGTDFATPDLPTEVLVRQVLEGSRSRLGSFRLLRVHAEPGAWTLYRLSRA